MKSAIPPTEFNRIVQTKSLPKTIAVLLNEAESLYSDKPLHWNAKRRYPFWRACPICGKLYAVPNNDQFHKKHHCSQVCATEAGTRKRRGQTWEQRTKRGLKPLAERRGKVITCPVCGKQVYKTAAHLRKVDNPTCSRSCNGKLRIKDLLPHSHKGRGAWTDASLASYQEKMAGPNNPAWKGGVTYFRKNGNYGRFRIKYVRCPEEYASMARKDGYVMEHRLLVAQQLERPLKRSEAVHHIDHNPENNAISNLMLFKSNSQHKKYEATGIPAPVWQL